jgi:hypothetical protein
VLTDRDISFGEPVVPTRTSSGSPAAFDRLPGGSYCYRLIDAGVSVEVRHLRRDRGQVHAEVDVRYNWPGARTHEGTLSCADQNLSSQASRKSLAKYCGERARTNDDEFDWQAIIDAACLLTLRAEREGDNPIVLDDAPDNLERDVNIYGIDLPIDSASMWWHPAIA